jgi:hypothetical protein
MMMIRGVGAVGSRKERVGGEFQGVVVVVVVVVVEQ